MATDRSLILSLVVVLVVVCGCVDSLHYDGYGSYSIYPRLDLHLCSNSSIGFDFTISTATSNSYNNGSSSPFGRLLVYAEQQVPINFASSYGSSSSSRKLVNSYFLVKLTSGNRLVINDYWNVNDVSIQLPTDYLTSWFRFSYTRRLNSIELNLFRFEYNTKSIVGRASFDYQDQPSIPKLVSVYSKFFTHANFLVEELTSSSSSSSSSGSYMNNDPTQAPYSQLLVGGIADNLNEKNFSYPHLRQLSKFHGYIMNLQYTSLASQCHGDSICAAKNMAAQRQYAIFSSSQSKQYKLKQFVDRDSLTIDDICESDTLTHEICPRDCSCLSNNLVAPYFNCDCSDASNRVGEARQQCTMAFKSFAINLDDPNYFGGEQQEKFEYPILPSFTKINVENYQTSFDKFKGLQFKSTNSYLYLSPNTPIQDSDACFWNIDECSTGKTTHLIFL